MSNERVFFIIVLPLIFILVNIAYFFLIALHELSHAIPALFFTKTDVKIFIGHKQSDINVAKPVFKINRLIIYVKPRLLYLRYGGYCEYSAIETGINQDIVILLAGQVVTFIVTILSCFTAFILDSHGAIKLITVILAVISAISLVSNLYPRVSQIKETSEIPLYSDGHQILRLLKSKIKIKQYYEGVDLYNNASFLHASLIFKRLLNENFSHHETYRLLVTSLIKIEDFEEALKYNDIFLDKYKSILDADDYCNSGFIKSRLDMTDASLIDYNESINLNPEHKYALNNRAYTYNLIGSYKESIEDLNKAITIDDEFAYSYSNRGLAKIKTGQLEEGLQDIAYSISLDDQNSYAYLNLGIYQLEQNNFNEALTLFEKAKELDRTTHHVENYIAKAKNNLITI